MKYKLQGNAKTRQVLMNGKPLQGYNSIRNHSPDGFNWGYGGSGPAQLALAVMLEHHRLNGIIPKVAYDMGCRYQQFKFDVIAGLPQGEDFDVEIDLSPYLLKEQS